MIDNRTICTNIQPIVKLIGWQNGQTAVRCNGQMLRWLYVQPFGYTADGRIDCIAGQLHIHTAGHTMAQSIMQAYGKPIGQPYVQTDNSRFVQLYSHKYNSINKFQK